MIRLLLFGLMVALATAAGMLVYIDRTRPVPDTDMAEPVRLPAPPEVWVLVAERALPARHEITAGDLGWTAWPEDNLQPFFTVSDTGTATLDDLEGLFTNRAYSPGEPLDMGALSTERVERLSDRVTPGMRAVSLAVSAETTAGGFIQVDDYVDIIRVSNRAEDTLDGRVLLQNVRVLAVGASMGELAGVGSGNLRETVGTNPGTVTVELTPREAGILAAADFDGRLALALRTRGDRAPLPPDPAPASPPAPRTETPPDPAPVAEPRHSIGVLQGETWIPYEVE